MAIALAQQAEGVSAVAVTAPAFSGATTSGNLVVLCFASDDYNGTPDAGWTQSAEMEQQTFHGAYIWWRISTGETAFQYTIGSATVSAWILTEWSGCDAVPYDISEGQFAASSSTTYTTASITPTTGNRVLIALMGGSTSSDQGGTVGTWLNSFTEIADIGTTAGATDDVIGVAYRLVVGDSSTAFSSGCTYDQSQQARSGLIISFIEAEEVVASIEPRAFSVHQGGGRMVIKPIGY